MPGGYRGYCSGRYGRSSYPEGRWQYRVKKRHDGKCNISKVQGELKVFYDGRDKFRRKFPIEVLQKMDIYIKIGQAIAIKERELARENVLSELMLQYGTAKHRFRM